ncbi:Nop-domain-containing protein [Exidia glandulosa HHB12029]|uniref:Nucleolar protein 56 n=1 Tax=Exidia glandulosa HHB12029 TaxID=1314781 RepID=A0A165P351_EXIGL|nr:Nop-domain-containing protein [Exidia glandulosa HHB12029]
MATHVLFEAASGYALFEVKQHEEIGAKTKAVQDSLQDLHKFGKIVSLVSFSPFKSAAHALENANDVSEGVLNDHLKSLIELNLSKATKKSAPVLGVSDKILGTAVNDALGVKCDASERSLELIRGIRLHAAKLLKGLEEDDVVKAQLGLGHSYSRAKVKFNVNRTDNMIIQAIALLDTLDKDVNTFAMRVREWYGYHFPELARLVQDNHQYARAAKFIGDKETLDEDKLPALAEILADDETAARNVLDAARGSMGTAISELDMLNIAAFADRVVSLAEYRKSLTNYLTDKMNVVAPSLTSLIGERIGARLISHAGSLTNLSKYPASTIQILGAEKALFRALKTKGKTPKYGLIYHSTYIGRAGPKFKGRISRFLANKCSIASRIDCFSDNPTAKFGDALRQQVEERLTFFETGAPPSKNADAMQKVIDSLDADEGSDDDAMDEDASPKKEKKEKKDKSEKKDKKKRKSEAMEVDEDEPSPKKAKKDKKEKKDKEEKKEKKKKEKKSKED